VLDVQPVSNPGGNKGEWKKCTFWAQRVDQGAAEMLWHVEGESEVFIDKMANAGPGDLHEVKLTWQGFIELRGEHVTRLLLSAHGSERLKFGSARDRDDNEVAVLPAGHRIDMACGVRYGIVGVPAAPDQVTADTAPAPPVAPQLGVPEKARQQIAEALGPSLLVFREKVLKDLNLSKEQAGKLEERLQDTVLDAAQFVQKVGGKNPEQREKELHSYRQNVQEKLGDFLKETLTERQRKRLRQVVLQREGLFALGDSKTAKELDITDGQRRQFVEVMQQIQKKIQPLIQEAESTGNAAGIRPKVMRIRAEQQDKIEAILSDAQKQRWKEMLGEPLDLGH